MFQAKGQILANENSRNDQQSSFAALYQRYWRDLCVHIRSQFGMGPPEPEDVAQSAFARFAALDDPRAVENPRAFLWRTAHNIVISHKRHKKVSDSYANDASHKIFAEQLDDLSTERVISDRERYTIVYRALEKMPRLRRRVLLLNRVHGLSAAEIARRMNMPVTTVKTYIYRAVSELEAALKAADAE